MKCPNCGWEGDTNFCENCGTPMPKSQHTGDSSETDDWNPPSPSGAAPWNSAEEQNWDGTSFQQFSSDEGGISCRKSLRSAGTSENHSCYTGGDLFYNRRVLSLRWLSTTLWMIPRESDFRMAG